MKKKNPHKVTVAWLTKERALERAEYIFDPKAGMTLDSVSVVHEDGAPVHAGELIEGSEYFVELETGILRTQRTIDLLPKVDWSFDAKPK